MEAGIRLHGYNRAIMHSKIMVMDGFYVATGSYNLNLRSARADLENEFFIQCESYGGAVRQRILGDCELSTPVEPGVIDRYRSRRSIPVLDALLRYLLL
jgi:phosphatidylserine/phosphatidylglycerophosphate/cardiolipin synthase-like enzyme